MFRLTLLGLLLASTTLPGVARETAGPSPSLQETILALDKVFFDAFNACDLETWKQYLAEDIEFYQDNDDVTTTRAALEPSFLDRCDENNVSRLRRSLVEEATEVHPIQGYGAVQFGAHEFWVVGYGEPDQLGGTPRFVHLWQNQGGAWQITRVISYGH
jgi:ketosteroid isomerase-like protein